MKGLELSKKYYEQFGEPMLRQQFPQLMGFIAIGLAGSGSECFGFDDEISRDHDFEPGFCIFVPGEDLISRRDCFLLERAYSRLPGEYMGCRREKLAPSGGNRRGVIEISEFLKSHLGISGLPGSNREWLAIPEYSLAETVNGEIWSDDSGIFSDYRVLLSKYPEDIRLKKLAGEILSMGQSGIYNYQRCLSHGETAAARMALYEFIKSAVHSCFLLSCCYMPYYKWAFRALRELPGMEKLSSELEMLSVDAGLKETEKLMYSVCESIISKAADNGLIAPNCSAQLQIDRAASALNDRITDPEIRNMHILSAV